MDITRCFIASAIVATNLLSVQTGRAQDPEGFVRETVVNFGENLIAAFEVLPNGHFVAGLRDGTIWIFDPEEGLPAEPFHVLSTSPVHEGGIIGTAFDPDFESNGLVYFTYTENRSGVRWLTICSLTVDLANPTTSVDDSYVELLTIRDNNTVIHFGGGILFLPDKTMLVGVGDAGEPEIHSQNPQTYRGALLRLNRDGSVPFDNPTFGDSQNHVYAIGLRNPFRLFNDPIHNQAYVIDVGAFFWEELNAIFPGANYGWPIFEGSASLRPSVIPPANYIDPALALSHSPSAGLLKSVSLTDGIVYTGDVYPAEFRNKMIIIDWAYDFTRFIIVEQDENGLVSGARHWFDNDWGAGTDLVQHNGELYFASAKYGGYGLPFSDSSISRLRYTGLSRPDITLVADAIEGPIPFDPTVTVLIDGDAAVSDYTITWTVSDGQSAEGSTSFQPTFLQPGVYDVEVEVEDLDSQVSRERLQLRATEEFHIQIGGGIIDITFSPLAMEGEWSLRRQSDQVSVSSGSVRSGIPLMPNPASFQATGEPLELVYTSGPAIVPRMFRGIDYGSDRGVTYFRDTEVSANAITGALLDTRGGVVPEVIWRLTVSAPLKNDGEPEQATILEGRTDADGLLYIPLSMDLTARPAVLEFFPEGHPVYTSPRIDLLTPRRSEHLVTSRIGFHQGGIACASAEPSGAVATFRMVESVFMSNCSGCHSLAGPAIGLVLTEGFALNQLLNRPSVEVPGLLLVNSENPHRSYLLEKITCAEPQVGRVMPVSGLLPEDQRQIVIDWILGGQLVEPEPRLSIHASSSIGRSPLPVTFLAGADFPIEGSNLVWDLGENGPQATTGYSVAHVFTATETAAVYTISLMAPDPTTTGTLLATREITVLPPLPDTAPPPIPVIQVRNPILFPSVPVIFDASLSESPNGMIISYEWDFVGNGMADAISTTPTATFIFESPGVHPVTLTIRDQADSIASISMEVVVSANAPGGESPAIHLY